MDRVCTCNDQDKAEHIGRVKVSKWQEGAGGNMRLAMEVKCRTKDCSYAVCNINEIQDFSWNTLQLKELGFYPGKVGNSSWVYVGMGSHWIQCGGGRRRS
jgi:hypothetical protein